jgi:hypothetical protein
MQWKPIETAPKDGQLLWLRRGDKEPVLAWWSSVVNDWSLDPAHKAANKAKSLLSWEERAPYD